MIQTNLINNLFNDVQNANNELPQTMQVKLLDTGYCGKMDKQPRFCAKFNYTEGKVNESKQY